MISGITISCLEVFGRDAVYVYIKSALRREPVSYSYLYHVIGNFVPCAQQCNQG